MGRRKAISGLLVPVVQKGEIPSHIGHHFPGIFGGEITPRPLFPEILSLFDEIRIFLQGHRRSLQRNAGIPNSQWESKIPISWRGEISGRKRHFRRYYKTMINRHNLFKLSQKLTLLTRIFSCRVVSDYSINQFQKERPYSVDNRRNTPDRCIFAGKFPIPAGAREFFQRPW